MSDIYTMKPFTIMVNSPSVSKMAGSDKIMTTGLRIVLTIEKIRPANRNTHMPAASSELSYPVPKILTATHSPIELRTQRKTNTKNCFFISYLYYTDKL